MFVACKRQFKGELSLGVVFGEAGVEHNVLYACLFARVEVHFACYSSKAPEVLILKV